ncbi:hypothetical protein [Nitrosomonas sp.]|uniref:hypothetical protein n=1 Tax=Nitrosomonas sp. TaxID=42353 RepID=UPI00261717F6|nr:hypothetical protein [Nitrosomonas sp.]
MAVKQVAKPLYRLKNPFDHEHNPADTNFAITMMVACYNLKRLAYFQTGGILPGRQ